MVRPSLIVRKARRAHERQQESLQKQGLPNCQGCDLCAATKAREDLKAIRETNTSCSQQQEHKQSLRSKIRQGLKNKLFRGTIVINPRHIALAEVTNNVDFCADQIRSVYWTDGSRLKNSCGIGVAYCDSTQAWTELSWHVRGSIKTHILEVYAIAKALEIAWEHSRNVGAEKRPNSICIYSDCAGALEYFARLRQTLVELCSLPHGEEAVGPGIIAAEELSALNVRVELKYVPGHSGVQGNLKADRAARRGAKLSTGKRKAGRLMNDYMSSGK